MSAERQAEMEASSVSAAGMKRIRPTSPMQPSAPPLKRTAEVPTDPGPVADLSAVPSSAGTQSSTLRTTAAAPLEPGTGRAASGRLLLLDPRGVWRNRMVALLKTIREEMPQAVLDSLTPTAEGYALRCRDVEAFRAAFAARASVFGDVLLASPPLRRPPVDVVRRGVDIALSEDDILEDLRLSLGASEGRAASTRADRRRH